MNKVCETGPPVYRPYPRRLESLIVCRCHYKDSTFSSVIFKTLSVAPARIRTRDLPLSRPALFQFWLTGWHSLRKCIEISLENLYVDIGA